MTQNIDEIVSAIGNPNGSPHQPEGGSDIAAPLNPLGLDRTGAEPFPAVVAPQQGAGSGSGGLTPGAQGSPTAGDGAVLTGYKGDAYAGQGGPEQRPILSGIAGLTAGQINTPADGNPVGSTAPAAAPVGRDDTALGRDQSTGAGLNPAFHWAEPGK